LRTRRYAPWNGKRGSPDLERWVIQQGSVIRLRLDDEPNAAALIERCTAGLGLHRECGLGRVWINPPLLADLHPNFGKVIEPQIAPKPGDVADTADHPAASDPLILWLRSQVETEGNRERIETQAQAIAGEYRERLAAARRELGISKDELFGPSRSQWGSVLETARAKTGNELLGALFETKDAVVKTTGEGWKEEFFEKNRRVKLGDWLKTRLSAWVDPEAVPARSTRDFPRLVQRLAHLCRTDTEKRPQ